VHPHALDGERSEDQLVQPLGRRLRRVEVALGEEDGELVAAEPGEDVAGGQPGLEVRPDLPQQLVTGLVPEAVVDLLEPVESSSSRAAGRRAVARASTR
jgi:hypothetical protein